MIAKRIQATPREIKYPPLQRDMEVIMVDEAAKSLDLTRGDGELQCRAPRVSMVASLYGVMAVMSALLIKLTGSHSMVGTLMVIVAISTTLGFHRNKSYSHHLEPSKVEKVAELAHLAGDVMRLEELHGKSRRETDAMLKQLKKQQ
ncbi:MAG: uncharacterized protein KVP18_001735 [Porospora cf. gigantea A]|uniref:uncharacterized protein n=1 Tax=Porospora cf. gigantea A TaxID=2853593 RepID=UPI00355AC6D0|nr:MAG: hypothetical protein KVP18_001735 [Porospora cf. gigantea A]